MLVEPEDICTLNSVPTHGGSIQASLVSAGVEKYMQDSDVGPCKGKQWLMGNPVGSESTLTAKYGALG